MVLENKLGITDQIELSKMEEKLSKLGAKELFDSGKLQELNPGTYESLKTIHKYLFDKIYNFAGETRNENIAKGNFRFAPVLYLDESIKKIEQMPQCSFDEIIEKYVEMNIAHPFREGNGRSLRIWLDDMLKKEINKAVDWSLIDKEKYLIAMVNSTTDDKDIKQLIKSALTDRINDRELYMKGIDHSYFYEGYKEYKTSEL